MKIKQKLRLEVHSIARMVASVALAFPSVVLCGTLELATTPLATATNTTVLPNLMFIMDGSGSMDWNYLPDWVNDNLCKGTSGSYDLGCTNQPPFRSPDFNGIYYNPDIYYAPAVNADGTSKGSQTTWTDVKNDAYGVQSTSKTNLVTNYLDREWCTDTTYTDCLRNDNYLLPGTVNGKVYNRERAVYATGTGNVASGTPDAATTVSRSFGPHYYRIIPGEYCDSAKLTNCQTTETDAFKYPAKLRWCNSAANASAVAPASGSCQALRTGSFTHPRYPTRFFNPGTPYVPSKPEVRAYVEFNLDMDGCRNDRRAGIGKIIVNGSNILPSATDLERYASSLADGVRSQSALQGYSFGGSGSTLRITAPAGSGNVTSTVRLERASGSNNRCTFSPTQGALGGYTAATPEVPATPGSYPGRFERTDIVSGQNYPRAAGRTDCKTSSEYCTYTEEMTNFANWWTYYQTRMQAMKTAASRAFQPIDSRYRVGFIDLWGGNYLPIKRFDAGVGNTKATWYAKLFSMNPNNGTPLRSALSRVGRIFAGKKPGDITDDPVEYSCQQNFALLTTDGYWNSDNSYESNDRTYYYPVTGNNGTDVKAIDGTKIGNRDGGTTDRPMYEGATATYNTLADVAKYYYDTDLRDQTLWSNCNGALNLNVCENNVFVSSTDTNVKQHMTTFSLGLGVDGTISYTSDYKTATSGDYHDITKGTGSMPNWSVPAADSETAVDDLWHAAVNGGGTYFSAKDPAQLTSGLSEALSQIGAKLGAGAAAATSTLNPVAGDNFAYVASYTTVKWQGNLEARTINLDTGTVSKNASWCVEDVVAGSCPAPGKIVAETVGSSTIYNCVTADSSAETCGGTLDGTTCKVPMQMACQGTLASKVGTSSDSRNIWMSNGAGSLVAFTYDNLSNTQKTYFAGTGLSQWSLLSDAQKTAAAGANLVNFLRGQTGFEDRTSNSAANRLYRYREATLGDAIESQPAFVGKPTFSYVDAGYSDFVTEKSTRAKTVFMGTNDGMLHAFNAEDGTERWAFIPSMVIPNLWQLADKTYASKHANYVNGSPVIGDVYDSEKAALTDNPKDGWRTILVGGLNGGGRGYYALDITDPANPSLLWEINSGTEENLGYTFGNPVITKKTDGTWVVLFTSGYNNTNPGDGKGYLYVRNALTGAHISRISTGTGSGDTPSGLSKIATWADNPEKNNTAGYTYGGDLFGNVWRFNINNNTVMKFAVLKDPDETVQPITARPELGSINDKRIVYIGTGKYLEKSDLDDTQVQTLYAIKDDNAATVLDNPRTVLAEQVIEASGAGRVVKTSTPVDFKNGRGWFIDFPDPGERVNVDLRLDLGTVFAPTTVPSNTVCSPGGYGWLNYFDYQKGTAVIGAENNLVSQKFNAPIVGINIFRLPNGKRVTTVVTADNPTPEAPPKKVGGDNPATGFVGKRVIWRELTP